MRKLLLVSILLGLIFLFSAVCMATDIYVTQNTSGIDSGADCANAHSASWFNSYATGGNTYHLCGTFTGTAGQNILKAPAGTAGNILKILFESNAVMTAPYWGTNDGNFPTGGAITVSDYVTVDGGTNGVIQNTLNGAAGTSCSGGTCADHISAGIYVPSGKGNIEIKNLTLKNIFLCNSSATCNSIYSSGIKTSGAHTNLSIHDNVISGTAVGIYTEYSGSALNNINYYNNTISNQYWGINVGSGSAGNSTSNLNIYGNKISNFDTWENYTNAHADGIIVFSTGVANTFNIYNNYITGHGNLTGLIFCTYGGSSPGASCNIFNNVLNINNNTCSAIGGGRAIWSHGGSSPHLIVNNTISGSNSSCPLVYFESPSSASRFQNNIVLNSYTGIEDGDVLTSNLANVNYNLYYGLTYIAVQESGGNKYYNYSGWQGLGFDANGVNNNPNLDVNYKLQAGSAAIGMGQNLSSLCTGNLAPLCRDKAGTARPSSGAWDIGAYQYSQSSVIPPASLNAIVN